MTRTNKAKRGRPSVAVNLNFGKNPFTINQALTRHNKSKRNTKLTREGLYAKMQRYMGKSKPLLREVKTARISPQGKRQHPTYRYILTPAGRKAQSAK